MKSFSLCAFADEAGPSVSEQIDALKFHNISKIELRGVDSKNVTELTLTEMRELKMRFDAEGISVWSIGSPIGKVDINSPFEKHLELFRHTLELAEIADARNMRIFSFYMNPDDAFSNEGEVIDRLGKMAELARDFGVTLCHENEKGIFGDITERCVKIHKALPAIRSVFDPANFAQCGCDTLDAWDALGEFVHYMHIKDLAKSGEVVPAGHGIGHLPELLEKYQGSVLTLEPHLAEFVGLAGLENGEATSHIGARYSSTRDAFDHGVYALKEILK